MFSSSLRNEILRKLHARNKQQRDGFLDLIGQNNKLQDTAEDAEAKQRLLKVEAERLKQENVELLVKVETGGGGSGGKAVQVLEQKLYKQMEELTELHRKKGENAQKLIDVGNQMKEIEKQMDEKDTKIKRLMEEIDKMKEKQNETEQNLAELQTANTILGDEHQSLHIAYVAMEEKFRKIVVENEDLVKRFMEYKAKAADSMNAQNDIIIKKKQDILKKQLEDAAAEHKEVILPPEPAGTSAMGPAVCFAVTVPKHAILNFEAHDGEVNAIKWSPSGRKCATGGSDRKVKIWEINNGRQTCSCTLLGSNAAIMSVEFDLQETLLLAATANDFSVRVWTIGDARLRQSLTGHSGKVSSAKFLSGSHKAASGSYDKTIKIWDLKRGACDKTVFVGSTCLDLVTSDGLATNVISGHFDRKIRFWDSRSERGANDISVAGRVTSLDLSQDGTSLLACTRNNELNVIDIRMNKIVKTLSDDHFHVGADYTRAVFSPDAMYAMAGSSEGHIFVWNILKKKLERVLKDGHHSTVLSCSWDPRGSSLLSCDKQRTVVYWSDF